MPDEQGAYPTSQRNRVRDELAMLSEQLLPSDNAPGEATKT